MGAGVTRESAHCAEGRDRAEAAERSKFRIDGAFDIECSDWDQFQIGALYDGRDATIFRDPDEMLDAMLRAGGVYWAHAGGVYDMQMLLERCRVRGIPCQVDTSQHRVTRIVSGRATFRDSYALWPVGLGEICGALGEPEPFLPWGCTCGRDCGGYCQISTKLARGSKALEEYVCADARILYRGLCLLREFTLDHQIVLCGTLGQTAWESALAQFGLPKSEMPYDVWRRARAADKGGRTTIVRPRVGDVMRGVPTRDGSFSSASGIVGPHHDICNAYPAQLAKTAIPIGQCSELGEAGATDALTRGDPGLYMLRVRVPDDQFLPPLPWRRGGQLCFPTGEFSGTWALPEIVAAAERGTQIVAVQGALTWETSAPLFQPLVERWYRIRHAAGRKTPLGKWVGAMAKALTGKFAEQPERQRVVMHIAPDKIRHYCSMKGPCRNKCTGRCGRFVPLDLFGYIWGIPYSKMSPSAYPEWSSYLRAMTRIQWLSQAELMTADPSGHPDGGKAVCMGNTDSLWGTSRQKPAPLGDGLGEWEYQHAWTDLEIRSPSVYAFRDPAKPGLQIRGVPGLTEEDWRRGNGRIDRGIVTFRRAAKTASGLFKRRSRAWRLPSRERLWFGDRKIHSDGLTYPVDAEELRAMWPGES